MHSGLKENTVEIHEYSNEWKDEYISEEQRLLAAINFSCVIEHIGSTSVIGFPAKPIIDIAVGYQSEVTTLMIENVSSCGYEYYGYQQEMGGHIFRKSKRSITTHLLHLVEYGGLQWCKYVLLKNLLEKNPKVRKEYASLKKELSNTYSENRAEYRKKKSEYIEHIFNDYLFDRKIKKISIFGPICSGKSTIARTISNSIGERVTYLDELFWQKELMRPTQEEWNDKKEKIYAPDRWIIDGNYIRSASDRRITQSDLIIYLDTPAMVFCYRFIKSYMQNEKRIGILHRQRDNLDFKHLKNLFLFNVFHRKRILNLLRNSTKLKVVGYHLRNEKVDCIIDRILNKGLRKLST